MKVGIFVEEVAPQTGGGYTIQSDLLRSLIANAHESKHQFFVFSQRPEDLQPFLKGTPVKTIQFPGNLTQRLLSRVQRDFTARRGQVGRQTRFEQVAAKHHLDFIWFIGAEAMQVDIPYMGIVWDLQHRLQPWFPEVSSSGRWEHRERFYSQFLRRATFVIAGTEAGSNEIQRFYQVSESQIKILPHPTPSFALQPEQSLEQNKNVSAPKELSISSDYLFYPAQFWPHKNHFALVSALQILRDEFALTLELVLVGSDKGNRIYVESLARQSGLSAQVHFLGFVGQQQLVSLYQNAFALTYLSHFGPENLPPLEAFALGCPVIAAAVDGAEEQLGNAALLVNPKDPKEIAKAIATLHGDPSLRTTLIERGRLRAASWTGKEFVRGVFEILDDFEGVRRCWD